MIGSIFRRVYQAVAQLSAGPALARVPWWVHALWLTVLLLSDIMQVYNHTLMKEAFHWPVVLRRALLTDVLASIVFYTNWVVLIPRTLGRSRLGAYILSVLLLILFYVALRLGISLLLKGAAEESSKLTTSWPWLTVPYTIFALMGVFFSSGLKITGDYLQVEHNRRELEKQQLLTELSLLKMQVNPHFLFNTLNNIYSLASQKSDRTPEAVLRLAEIMRYMLYDSSADTVPLTLELKHLRSFLDLQRLRLPAAATDAIVFELPASVADTACPIAPMLLFPLVENAFKHGDLSARPVVAIELQFPEPHRLHFLVRNPVAPPTLLLPAQPGGVGLTNLHRRLELLYPGRHTLTITERGGQYLVEMVLHIV
ncbi:sensor histidine kinase [Hymenobacter sp. BT730]|uniref:sensor histidine kinase n=1 Tax=Hymenobacter sp. BT730 TaxID=3063332 RepID=UPI0026DFA89C|nr:sensor histidine kinase [Hymenobacter sp. BT730]